MALNPSLNVLHMEQVQGQSNPGFTWILSCCIELVQLVALNLAGQLVIIMIQN